MKSNAISITVEAGDIARGDILAHEGIAKAVDYAATIGETTILELHDGAVITLPAHDRRTIIR